MFEIVCFFEDRYCSWYFYELYPTLQFNYSIYIEDLVYLFHCFIHKHMKKIAFVFLCLSFITAQASITSDPPVNENAIIGRWDLTVKMGDRIVPSWLEVKLSGVKTLVGYFVAEGGSARPIAHVYFKEGKVNFSIPPQWERSENDMQFEAVLLNDQLSGTITSSYGKVFSFTAERAPLLKRDKAPL